MNQVRFFVTLIAALVITGTFAVFADDGEVKERHRLKFKTDGASEVIDIDDLEVGETHQFFTESGKEVVVTRNEDGLELSVDGKEIKVLSPGGHHGASVIHVDGEECEGKVNVFVKKMVGGEGEEGEHSLVWHEGGEGEGGENVFVWHSDGEEGEGEHASSFVFERKDVLSHVLESGVLDRLDAATRDEIIEVIKEAEGPHKIVRTKSNVIVIEKSDEDE